MVATFAALALALTAISVSRAAPILLRRDSSSKSPDVPPSQTPPVSTAAYETPLLLNIPSPGAASASSIPAVDRHNVTTKAMNDTAASALDASQPMVMGYYPDWAGDDLQPEAIDFKRFDWIDYAFALPTSSFGLNWDDKDDAPKRLQRLVTAAHAAGVKVKLSIGGWANSKYFSAAVSTSANREKFAASVLKAYHNFTLDGIDIDWEYPSQAGDKGNAYASSDTSNFLTFLRLLRTKLPSGAVITAAAQPEPFADADGEPMKDASAFADALDWILIMNYDTWGNDPGPNAPLSNACKNSTQPRASAQAAVHNWVKAGVPATKLVLGVPAYGYLIKSSRSSLVGRNSAITGAAKTAAAKHVLLADDGTDEGQVRFSQLIKQGALAPIETTSETKAMENALPGVRAFGGAIGMQRGWDACSSTPFLHGNGRVVSYDDTESIALKAALARAQGMKGVNLWELTGDTAQGDLLSAVRAGLGLSNA